MRLTLNPSSRDTLVEYDRMCPVCHASGVVVAPFETMDDCLPCEVVCDLCGFRFFFVSRLSLEVCHD